MPEPARSFGKYLLLKKVALGGMGEIWVARRKDGTGDPVILKTILEEKAKDPDYVQKFFVEAALTAKMAHPNIVRVLELAETEGTYYLTMEWVRGRSLKDIVERAEETETALHDTHRLTIATHLTAGLAYVHTRRGAVRDNLRIVHRDISPANVVVSYEGEVKLIDFGIATAGALGQESREVKGRFVYMSPEQSVGKQLDARSDVFSTGVLIYELFSGENPFVRRTPIETVDAVHRFNPPPLASLNPAWAALDPILTKALTKDPAGRYQSAQQMTDALDELLDEAPPPPQPLGELMTGLFAREKRVDDALARGEVLPDEPPPPPRKPRKPRVHELRTETAPFDVHDQPAPVASDRRRIVLAFALLGLLVAALVAVIWMNRVRLVELLDGSEAAAIQAVPLPPPPPPLAPEVPAAPVMHVIVESPRGPFGALRVRSDPATPFDPSSGAVLLATGEVGLALDERGTLHLFGAGAPFDVTLRHHADAQGLEITVHSEPPAQVVQAGDDKPLGRTPYKVALDNSEGGRSQRIVLRQGTALSQTLVLTWVAPE